MKKTKFYLCLNILNIVLALFIVAMIYILSITLIISKNFVMPTCTFLFYIIIKILFLPILFRICEKKIPISILNNVAIELKTNKKIRKSVLLLAFCYEVAIFVFPLLKAPLVDILSGFIFFEIYSLGGVGMFYIALFTIWKLQGKLKD